MKIQYTMGEGYVYTPYVEENHARSIYEVASSAYDKYSSYQAIQNYVNKVADFTWDRDTFAVKDGVKGSYTIDDISLDNETATITVSATGDFKSVLINGKRLVSGNSVNVAIGDYVYKFSGFTAQRTFRRF